MAQFLLLSTAVVRTLALYIFWCAGLGEVGFTLDASNAGLWMFVAWVITLGCAAMGREGARSAAWIFLLGDGLIATVFLFVAMMGGIPAGFVGISVHSDAVFIASVLLFATMAFQVVLLRQPAAQPSSRRVLARSSLACWIGAALLVAGLAGHANAGRSAAQAQATAHKAYAAALSADGRGAAALGEARRSLLILAVDPAFADPGRSRGQCLCAGGFTIPSRVTAKLAEPPVRWGFTYLWLGGYERALTAGLADDVMLTLYLNTVSMGRTAPREYEYVTGFFAASEHHFGQPPQALTDEAFFDLTLTLATRGFVAPNDEAQVDRSYAVGLALQRMEQACSDTRLLDHLGPGCALFEAQRGR